MSDYSPMMQHYLETKKEYSDCILFYRLGDFYEMFFEDAKIVSKELDLVLTGRDCGTEERAPMCGVPYHAVESYLSRLIKAGYKVAICEQLEDPKTAKGIVKRDVIRIVTPGTNIDTTALSEDKNNYLCALIGDRNRYGLAFCDVSTGDFFATEVDTTEKLLDEYHKYEPTEIITNDRFAGSCPSSCKELFSEDGVPVTVIASDWLEPNSIKKTLCDQFQVTDPSALGLEDLASAQGACAAAIRYLQNTQKLELTHMRHINVYSDASYMLLDAATRRNLELSFTMRDKEKKGSLFGILDKTKTAMGARLLRSSIEQPLVDASRIARRADAVEEFFEQTLLCETLREQLDGVYDLERLLTRISYKTANPRDLIAFKQSIGVLNEIAETVRHVHSGLLTEMKEAIDPLEDLYSLIDAAIADDPPVSVHDGDIIRDGFMDEVDTLRKAKTEGKAWLGELESREREKTGIKNLKIKYNKVFGYYLEVTNSYKEMVPDYFIRKQTLTNAERFFTPELKDLENTILGAQDRLVHLEYELYQNILNTIQKEVTRIQEQAKLLAQFDMLSSLAAVARNNHYVRPTVTTDDGIDIRSGRHPVIEQMIPNGQFIANDTFLDEKDTRISIITGPNMAGKSTYMRQTALIVLLAQIGSFVPAKKATIGVVDRIFTRVGASDDLASGQSTFMVEMNEVANILRYATGSSLLILDEIGRGTSTFDGLAIAWAVVEYISNTSILGAKTLFATHYHELTELEGKLEGVRNFCIAVKEQGDDIVFLRKIIPGGADKSYGIQVAKLAGVPEQVIERAKEIVGELAEQDVANAIREAASGETKQDNKQLSFFDRPPVKDSRQEAKDTLYKEVLTTDLNQMTPIDALTKLFELQKIAKDWS